MSPLRINLWSGPRNVSTALMYSFAQRGDTRVVDEPLYAHYLRVSGADHPGRDDVLRSLDQDGARVVSEVILGPCDREVIFFKQMAHHLVELDRSFLGRCANVLLTRDPRDMVPSLVAHLREATLRDTGYATLVELYGELRAIGQEPPVLDARELLTDPRSVLGELCRRLGLPFEEAMLRLGARPEAGGRDMGAALVRGRSPIGGLRVLSAAAGAVSPRARAAPARVPAALRAAARARDRGAAHRRLALSRFVLRCAVR